MGAGLQQNHGLEWGPQLWENMTTTSPNHIFSDTAHLRAEIAAKSQKRKDIQNESKLADEGVNTLEQTIPLQHIELTADTTETLFPMK